MSPNSGNGASFNLDLLEEGLLSPASTTANTPIKYVLNSLKTISLILS